MKRINKIKTLRHVCWEHTCLRVFFALEIEGEYYATDIGEVCRVFYPAIYNDSRVKKIWTDAWEKTAKQLSIEWMVDSHPFFVLPYNVRQDRTIEHLTEVFVREAKKAISRIEELFYAEISRQYPVGKWDIVGEWEREA